MGLTKTQAVLTIYLTTAACGLGALLLHQVNLAGAVVVVLLIGCLLSRDRDFGNDGAAAAAVSIATSRL